MDIFDQLPDGIDFYLPALLFRHNPDQIGMIARIKQDTCPALAAGLTRIRRLLTQKSRGQTVREMTEPAAVGTGQQQRVG